MNKKEGKMQKLKKKESPSLFIWTIKEMLYPKFFSIKIIILRSIFIEFINIYECIIYIFKIIIHKAKWYREFIVHPHSFALWITIVIHSAFLLFFFYHFFIFLNFFKFLIIFFTFFHFFLFFFNIDVIEN
jgi:hypothetical protein